MVALADWYILPILFQLEKLSGPSRWAFLRLGCPKFIHRVLQVVYSTKCMALSILPTSVNDQLIFTTTLGGSSIFRPMIKFHAVGQDNYTNIYITVYIHAAIFVESSRRCSSTNPVTLPLSSCPHGPSCVVGSIELMLWSHF